MENYDCLFVGIDVGTGSARAALVTNNGKILKTCVKKIETWNPLPDHYEQSSENIWQAICYAVKNIIRDHPPLLIKGIGFDATCSLVVLSKEMKPISVSSTKNDEQNVILWMDHRANVEADHINLMNHSILRYVGGKVSVEMQMPKLLWLKKNCSIWNDIGAVFDLPDYLTWRATNSNSRSLCSVICKWNYGVESWNEEFLTEIGLSDLIRDNYVRIGKDVISPGTPCGNGLTKEAANDLGLLEGTSVGASIIDAHAGGLGMLGSIASGISNRLDSRLSLICGTSTCHMAITNLGIFIPGIWGPYYSAMVPDYWLNEAGQSASGALIDHIINSHPVTKFIREKCEKDGILVQEYLNNYIYNLASENNLQNNCFLTENVHVWPDFHGNRSPIGDSNLLGMISGLSLSCDEKNLAIMYLATLQSLAYGTKHIIERLQQSGYMFESILICGGLAQNKLFVQIQADTVQLPILCPEEKESVLLGAAILAACGAKYYANVEEAMQKMASKANVIYPELNTKYYHDKKYKVFLKMLDDQYTYKKMMS